MLPSEGTETAASAVRDWLLPPVASIGISLLFISTFGGDLADISTQVGDPFLGLARSPMI